MFRFRRWWLLCGAVLVGVVALNGVADDVVDAHPVAASRTVCVRGGAKARDGVSGRGLVCVQTTARGLRWQFQPTVVTTTTTTSPSTTTTTTVSGVVAPVLVSVSASDGVQITVAGMRPDTGVYSLQWVPYGQTFNMYQMARATSPSMNVPAGWFACNRTYTFRVFVMQADWQLADGHQTQNVTPHSTPFDVVMPACPAATVPAVACADGGVCVVGDTGPGGGIVFYVQASGGTFTCGVALTSTCKYLEVAPSGWNTGADPQKMWAVAAKQGSDIGDITNEDPANNNASGIGLGYKNSLAIVNQGNDTTTAAGAARAYGGGSKSDWYLPTTAELNLLCQWARNVAQSVTTRCTGGTLNFGTGALGGFSRVWPYWSSSEVGTVGAWDQSFDDGIQSGQTKNLSFSVRPVRAFGPTG